MDKRKTVSKNTGKGRVAATAAAKAIKASKKGKKEVTALGYSDIPKYRAAKAGYYDMLKSMKGDKGGKKDYNSMPFKNRDIDRITNPKTGMKNYQDYIDRKA